jgi:hypothetical protein
MPKPLRSQQKNNRGAEVGSMRFKFYEHDPVTQDLAFIDEIQHALLGVKPSRLVLLRRVFKLYAEYLQYPLGSTTDPATLKQRLADELENLLQASEA